MRRLSDIAADAGRRVPPILAASLLLAWSAALADDYPRQPGVDVEHYAFRLTLSDDVDAIEAEATVVVRFVVAGLTEFRLDLASESGGKGMTVEGVARDGAPVAFDHRRDRLLIPLDPAPGAGERRSYAIRYRGVPAGGLRIGPNKHGERTFFSENWPDRAREWLPTIDHPSDKATVAFRVTAPSRYQVVANGLLREEVDLGDGRRTTHWEQAVPISPWLTALGVAQFATRHLGEVRGVPIQTWAFHQDREVGILAFDGPARRAMDYFDEFIGPFPYEKLAHVEAAGLQGGTEHAGAIFYGETSIGPKPATNLVAHEVAHQWFGDSVTERDWDDVWLSEGFATYFTLLFIEHDRGRDAFVAGLKKAREVVFAAERTLPGVAVIHDDLDDMGRVLNPLVYQKGAWTLHMLRTRIGPDAFRSGIRTYYRKHRDGLASTDDFRHAMEAASGADLSWFFNQWLRRPGSPQVEGTWRYDPAEKRIVIELAQVHPGEPYRLPLEVGILLPDDPTSAMRVEPIELFSRSGSFSIPADAEPASVTLDPNTTALIRARFGRK